MIHVIKHDMDHNMDLNYRRKIPPEPKPTQKNWPPINIQKNWVFSQPKAAFLPLQGSKLSNFRTQFLSNFQSPKFKFSVPGKKNVRLFEVMTKTSVLSDKNVPLTDAWQCIPARCQGVCWNNNYTFIIPFGNWSFLLI